MACLNDHQSAKIMAVFGKWNIRTYLPVYRHKRRKGVGNCDTSFFCHSRTLAVAVIPDTLLDRPVLIFQLEVLQIDLLFLFLPVADIPGNHQVACTIFRGGYKGGFGEQSPGLGDNWG